MRNVLEHSVILFQVYPINSISDYCAVTFFHSITYQIIIMVAPSDWAHLYLTSYSYPDPIFCNVENMEIVLRTDNVRTCTNANNLNPPTNE